jgi:ferric-dicitrate binding protein FerR (iron transport regulator)
MKRDVNDALDECLTLLEEGHLTLEECLARYPEHASELRQPLEVALEVRRVPPPISSPAAFTAGKQRMLEALAEKQRRQAASRTPFAWSAGGLTALFGRRDRPTKLRYTLAFSLALAVMIAFALCLVGGLSLVYWPNMTIAQRATLDQISGVVEILPANDDTWRLASVGERIEAGYRIRTSSHSTARLVFFEGSTTDLMAGTEVAVIQVSARREGSHKIIALHQRLGRTYSRVEQFSDRASRFEIETPTAVAGVCGTEFAIVVEADGTTSVAVVEGLVEVTAQDKTVTVLAGKKTTVQPERPPSNPAQTTPPPAAPAPTTAASPTATTDTSPALTTTRTPNSTLPPPGHIKTPQPPGHTKTPQPPGHTKTPQPPGHTKKPKPTKVP